MTWLSDNRLPATGEPPGEPPGERLAVETLQAKVDAIREQECSVCREKLCGHDALFSIALGFLAKPRCWKCLAEELRQPPVELRDYLLRHFQQRDCYREVWQRELSREDVSTSDGVPECLAIEASQATHSRAVREEVVDSRPDAIGKSDAVWDAGDMACGDLVLMLRQRMQQLASGAVLKLIARDPGAAADIPAWCRMTGHQLLAGTPPEFFIQRKE